MFIDLNVPVPAALSLQTSVQSQKKGKGKQQATPSSVVFSPAQISAIENRIDLLFHLGYTVFALNQVVQRKVDPKSHVNVLDPLFAQLHKRTGVVMLKRLTIVLDEESEKGFGLTNQNASLFSPYDLIALLPTTLASFSLACLTHSLPSPLTAHIIALPLTLPRLPFHLKHTLVRSALKNGAVFEISYAGALGADWDPNGSGSEGGAAQLVGRSERGSASDEGKGILVSGGVVNDADLRAPRDVGNLITVLGLSQNVAHDASTKVPQSLILRAQTRRTYRAVFSEPKVIIPASVTVNLETQSTEAELMPAVASSAAPEISNCATAPVVLAPSTPAPAEQEDLPKQNGRKRPLDEGKDEDGNTQKEGGKEDGSARKRKKKKMKDGNV